MRPHARVVLVSVVVVVSACRTAGHVAPPPAVQPVLGERSQVQGTPADRDLIRRGRMESEVEELAAAQARLERALCTLGGRVANMDAADKQMIDHVEYSLRVPSNHLDAMMDSIATLGRVKSRSVSAVDVTDQLIDVEARVQALRASRDRLRQLLERAATVQDVITVERELARVQGELDSLEGRLNTLKGQVALSELTVRLDRRVVLGPVGLALKGTGVVIGKLFVWR